MEKTESPKGERAGNNPQQDQGKAEIIQRPEFCDGVIRMFVMEKDTVDNIGFAELEISDDIPEPDLSASVLEELRDRKKRSPDLIHQAIVDSQHQYLRQREEKQRDPHRE